MSRDKNIKNAAASRAVFHGRIRGNKAATRSWESESCYSRGEIISVHFGGGFATFSDDFVIFNFTTVY